MINTQLLIVLQPLFDVNVPANAQITFNVITQIATFDFVNLKPLVNRVFMLNDSEPLN